MMMSLVQALQIQRRDVVAFVGAGGKTSLLVALGAELHALGWRVLATTTTRIGQDELGLFPQAFHDADNPQDFKANLDHRGYVFAYSDIRAGKAYGLSPEKIAAVSAGVSPDALLIEADGARKKWLKAPYPHEPVIPPETTLVIPVVSYLSVGQSLDETHIYNPQAIAAKVGAPLGDIILPEWIAALLSDTELGLKHVPISARVVAFINAVPSPIPDAAHDIARSALASGRLQGVILGDTRLEMPVLAQ
jgi:probable selenium-dependent hydroxylase accessory protein YqeC